MHGTHVKQMQKRQHRAPASLQFIQSASRALRGRATGLAMGKGNGQEAKTHICMELPSFASLVIALRWQKGQSIHCG